MRIAVSNPDNLGDFIIRQPMLAALAAAGNELILIVRAHVAPLAAWAMPGATIVQCVADPYRPSFQLDAVPDDRLIKAVAAFDPDIFVVASFQHTQLEEQLAQHIPRAKAIGFGGELFQNDAPRNITHVSAINLAVQVQVGRDWHESRKNELLASAILGTSVSLPPPRLTAEERFLAIASARLQQLGLTNRKFWIVCAGQGSAYTALKNWNLEKWATVCSAMVRDHGLQLIFVGTPAEHESSAAIRALMGELAENTFDMTVNPDGLDMLVGLTALSDGYLGKDTGPMHIAAALGKPIVSLFGGGHWPRFLPSAGIGRVLSVNVPCSDCNWICPYKISYCVKNIPTEAVRDAIDAVLTGVQKELEVTLLEPEPWVARAMILDAADTARNAMRVLEAERGNFTQWHDDRVRDIDGLRHALSLVESEKSALAAAVAEQKSHETEFGDLQRQLFEYQAESANLRQENATLQSSLNALASSSSEQIETLRAELTSLCEVRQTNQILEDRLTRIRHRTARRLLDYKSRISSLQQQLAVSLAESSDVQQQNTALQSSLNALASSSTEQIEALRAELTSLRDVLQTNQLLEDRLTHFRHRTARRLLDYKSRIATLQQQLAVALAESSDIQQQNIALQSSLNALSSSSCEQIETLRAELTSLRDVLQTNQILEDRLTRFRHRTARRLLGYKSRIATLSASANEELEKLRDELATLRPVLQTNQILEDRLTHFRHRTARRLLDYKSHIAILQQQAAEAQRLDQLLPELEALREENNRLDKECYQRAASLDAARAALDQVESRYQGTIADLRQQLHRAEEELRSVLTLVPELRDDLAHCLADVARLPGIEQDLAHKQSLIQQLTQTLELVEADRANRGQQIALLHTHIEHQHARIAELETTLLPRRLVNLLKKS